MQRNLDNPTPFTVNSVGSFGARKDRLQAKVFVRDIAASYLEPFEFGGQHKLNGQALLNPKNIKLNKFGNLARNKTQQLKAKENVFVPEWEATLGLPDLCAIGEVDSMIQRQRAVISKLFGIGGQSVAYFTRIAGALGYTISITQYRQACSGMSVCGDAINGEEWPFTWLITAPETTINYAQCGLTYCGDPLRSWGNKQLECRLTVLNPSHTILKFGYIS